MKYEQMKTAIAIISKCDCLTITEDDKKLIISVFGAIIESLREMGLVTMEISVQYAILKDSTWSDGYFCIVAKQMCHIVYSAVDFCAQFELLMNTNH